MIDLDEVADDTLWASLIFNPIVALLIGCVLLWVYFTYSKPQIDACVKSGGVMVKVANGEYACVMKNVLVQREKNK